MQYRQHNGSSLVSVLVLLVGLMLILSCYDPSKVPESIRDYIPKPKGEPLYTPEGEQGRYLPPIGTYAVQVFSTANQTIARDFQYSLKKDGYPARVELDRYKTGQIYYKIRIGTYQQRETALSVRDRVLSTYSKHFDDSFIHHY